MCLAPCRKTAKNFVAAANFLELLKVFGDIDSEVEEKIKYAKWRAADIVKAIRDGRQPAPPPGANNNKTDQDLIDASLPLLTGFDNTAASANVFSPPAAATSSTFPLDSQPPVHQQQQPPQQPAQGGGGAPAFPTISNFPSPPLGHSANTFNNNDNSTNNYSNNTGFNGSIDGGGMNNNNWNQSRLSPNLNQGQIPYNNNPAGSPPVHQQPQQPQLPPSNYNNMNNIQPTLPVSPTPPASQYSPYQPPAPTPAPAPAPVSNPYTPQPQQSFGGYNSPSAPYQQPTAHSPYVPAAPAMVLDPAVSTQIQKHCKWTVSALTYDDIPTAIDNLEKALALLRVSAS